MTTTARRKPAPRPKVTRTGRVADARDVYERVTDRVLELLDRGVAPWQKPWATGNAGPAWLPVNASSKKQYRGINVWLLVAAGYQDNRWVTFKQALDLGGSVRKGEHGTKIVLWRETRRTIEDATTGEDTTRRSIFATEFTVFNVEQCDGLSLPARVNAAPPAKEVRHAEAERVLVGYLFGTGGPGGVAHAGDRAFYSPDYDQITLPPQATFASLDNYYTVAFHEAGHSTGHKSRLNRPGIAAFDHFGTGRYGEEELVAEFTASFLAAVSGIERTLDLSASYLDNWAKAIKADKKLLVTAAGRAQKAADLILAAGAPAAEEGEDA